MLRLPHALVGVALAALVACSSGSSDTEPAALPPAMPGSAGPPASSPSRPVTPSTRPSDPTVGVPTAARANTAQGATAFVRYWYEQLNLAYATLDADALDNLSDPTCQSCRGYIKNIRSIAAARQEARGVEFEVLAAEAPPLDDQIPLVSVLYRVSPYTIVSTDGQIVDESDGDDRLVADVQLKRQDDGWTTLRVIGQK